MSSTQSLLETILGNYRDRERKVKADCDAHDKLLKEKTRAREKELEAIADDLRPKRTVLAVMTADYKHLEAELTAAARARDTDAAAIGERVKTGQAAIAEILSAKGCERKARIEATEKLADAARLIRTLAAEIYRLEFQEAAAKERIYAYQSYPAELQVQKLLAEIDTLRVGIASVQGGGSKARFDLDRAKDNVDLCAGKFALSGMVWPNLSYEEMCDVRLDPRLPDAYLPELEKILAEIKPGDARYHLTLRSGIQTGSGYSALTYRQEVEMGAFLETSKSAEKKGGEKK
jgi:outer membrane murein-binding lipoprotein Lpp